MFKTLLTSIGTAFLKWVFFYGLDHIKAWRERARIEEAEKKKAEEGKNGIQNATQKELVDRTKNYINGPY